MSESEVTVAKFDMKIPFLAMLIAAVTGASAYYGQRESTSVALTEVRGELTAVRGELTSVKGSMLRIETDRYTGSDARRDFAWRDERATEYAKRVAELETEMRRRQR